MNDAISSYLNRPTRSLDVVRAEKASCELLDALGTLCRLARAKPGYERAIITIQSWDERDATITVSGHTPAFGGWHVPLWEATRQFRDWLTRDDVALGNLTLGLTADGRFVDAPETAE